jgi:WD40 repeat protein
MHALRIATGQPVTHLTFSPDGSLFATAQPHTGVTVYDRATGEPVRTVGTNRATTYTSVVFLDGGARVAASSSRGLEVFDAATGAAVGDPVPLSHMRHYRLVASGVRLLTALNGTVTEILLPPRASVPGWRTVWDKDAVHSLSPDGRLAFVVRARAKPVLIDLRTDERLAVLDHPLRRGPYRNMLPASFAVVEFAAESNRFAVCDGQTIEVFDPATEDSGCTDAGSIPRPRAVLEPVFRLERPEDWPPRGLPPLVPWRPPFTLTPDGRGLLMRGPKLRVQLWDVDTGSLRCEWNWRLEAVACLAVAPDGLTAMAGGRFGRIVTWDLE